jgi:hypothetical protein
MFLYDSWLSVRRSCDLDSFSLDDIDRVFAADGPMLQVRYQQVTEIMCV